MPYALGLQSAVDAFLSAGMVIQLAIAVFALFLVLYLSSTTQKDKDDAPVTLPGGSVFSIYPFFRQRFDFLNRGFRITGQSVFQFNLLGVCPLLTCVRSLVTLICQNAVVVISGESARKIFFTTRGFDLNEGFKILSGAVRHTNGTPLSTTWI
jgi:hypothetical protein